MKVLFLISLLLFVGAYDYPTENVIIIMVGVVNHYGNIIQPSITQNEILNMMWNTIGANLYDYYLDSSGDKFILSKNTSNIISINTTININDKCDQDLFQKIIFKKMSQKINSTYEKSVEFYDYKYRIIILPNDINCNWDGLANLYCSMLYCTMWIRTPNLPTMIHEFGHLLGNDHASTDHNSDYIIDNEYGDKSDVMGYTNDVVRFNFPHLIENNWVNSNNILKNISNGYILLKSASINQKYLKFDDKIGIIYNDLFISCRTKNNLSYDKNLSDDLSNILYIHYFPNYINRKKRHQTILLKKIKISDMYININKGIHIEFVKIIDNTCLLSIFILEKLDNNMVLLENI